MNKKLLRRLLLVFVIIVLISAAVIYFTFDIRALQYLTLFKPWSIAAAFGILAVGLSFDGLRLLSLARVTDERLSVKEVINVVLSNYFLAVLTPGASGGAIAQIMFMKRANVPVAKATVIVFVRTIMSITFLILLVPVVLYSDPFLSEWMPPAVIATVSVIFISIPVAVVLLMRTRYPEFWLVALTSKFSHDYRRKCFNSYNEFKKASFIIGRHPLMVLRAFIESGFSLLGIYATVPMFFLGMNIQFDWLQVMGRMVLLNLVLYFSPTPGGSGIAEAGFLVLFTALLPEGTVGIMAVLWRFTAEYFPFLLGAFVSIRAFGSNIMSANNLKERDS